MDPPAGKWILCKHDDDDDVVEEEGKNKSKSSPINNKRKMWSDLGTSIRCAVVKKKKRKMNNMSKQEEEEEKISNLYTKSSSSSSNKRKRNQSSSSSSNKRKRNHLTSLNRNKRRNKKMLNYTTREQHHNKSSSSSSSKNNDDVYKAIRYVRKRKMNCDQDTILSKNKRNNPGKAKTDKVHNTSCNIIKIGDTVDLSALLFTKKRNFLIKSNQQRVKAKDLSGKFVVLYFMTLAAYYDDLGTVSKHLVDIHNKLQPKGDFEIVLVAINDHFSPDPHQIFMKMFSTMPWPAIPFSDLECRKCLENLFNNYHRMPCSVIIDPTGFVLQYDADPLFLRYGAAAYPFTNERIQSINSEDNLLMQQPLSIQKLLATPERDYLVNNNGDQVPLDGLDHKAVGLYFCPCLDEHDELHTTGTLKKLYQELSENSKEFEIVLIYTHGWCEHHDDTCGRMVEDSFLNEIKTMPWLALPFNDTNCSKKLQRIFQQPQELGVPVPARMVIIGPHGKFIELLGTHILLSYGAPAYPFSFRSAVNLELEMLKKLKLEMFWDLDTVFMHTNGSRVRFSQYIGKRIIILFQNVPGTFNSFWREMKARYIRMKGTDDEFEVIHIYRGVYINRDKKIVASFPWFMHAHLDQGSEARKYINRVWPDVLTNCGLIAFDQEGSIVRMKKDPELGQNMVFPFYQDGDMENEVSLHVREYINIKCKLECVNEGPDPEDCYMT
ncbi:putative nucleoredoxin 1 [Apium graveolens]|uniref:putative nucleoredoxin 1 n=1 Tax=Apium graveolens TaxID=4045 RepID=UPI003D7BD4B7